MRKEDKNNFTAAPKYETPPVDETKFTCKIVKVWDDEGNADKRPENVTVDLLYNGKVFDTAVLSSQNGWTAVWDGLNEKCHWAVAEREIEGYTVEISRECYILCDISIFFRRCRMTQTPLTKQ